MMDAFRHGSYLDCYRYTRFPFRSPGRFCGIFCGVLGEFMEYHVTLLVITVTTCFRYPRFFTRGFRRYGIFRGHGTDSLVSLPFCWPDSFILMIFVGNHMHPSTGWSIFLDLQHDSCCHCNYECDLLTVGCFGSSLTPASRPPTMRCRIFQL